VIMHLCIFLILHFPRLRGVSRRKFRRRRPLRNHRRLLSGRNQIIDNCPTIDDRLHKGTRLRARDSATALSLTPLVVNRQPRVSVIKTDARERERERERASGDAIAEENVPPRDNRFPGRTYRGSFMSRLINPRPGFSGWSAVGGADRCGGQPAAAGGGGEERTGNAVER